MLESTFLLADESFSGTDGQSFVAIERPTSSIDTAQARPYEPSTLLLAFVGMATVAIYYMATGGLRKPRMPRQVATSKPAPEQRRAA